MSDELKTVIADGLRSVQEKIGGELQAAMTKFDGQLKEQGEVQTETRDAVQKLSVQYKEVDDRLRDIEQKGVKMSGPAIGKTAGLLFAESPEFKALSSGQREKVRVEVKATVVSDSTTVFPYQNPGIIGGAFVPLTVRDILTSVPISSNMANSLREASWTNSAAEVSQGAAKNESDISFEQYNVAITTVAHWIKVSNQLLADAPAIARYIDTRLRDGLAQRVDRQLLLGNGTSPNLSGFTDSGNYTAYTPTSDDLLVDAINRAKYTLWAAGYQPTAVVVNPADWGAMERSRESAGSGMYLYGLPGMNAGTNPFGLRVVLSTHLASGKMLIGDFSNSATLWVREGVAVEMGYINEDFTKNLVTIRAEERLGLGVERAGAFYYGDFTA
jgi:HK97 family phage major capsid protein